MNKDCTSLDTTTDRLLSKQTLHLGISPADVSLVELHDQLISCVFGYVIFIFLSLL